MQSPGSALEVPDYDYKPEGVENFAPATGKAGVAAPSFFGGDTFDPATALALLSATSGIRNRGADLQAFASLNAG